MRITSYDVNFSAKRAYFERNIKNTQESFALSASNDQASFSSYDDISSHSKNISQASEHINTFNDGEKVLDGSNLSNTLLANFAKHGVEILHGFSTKSLDESEQEAASLMMQTHAKSESVSFSSKAYVKTDDGRQIEIELNYTAHSSSLKFGALSKAAFYDPLVISLNGTAPQFGDKKFEFDIDHDGTSDQISTLGQNSGFLVRDISNDGKIDSANELFGTRGGDGFKELAEFDDDKNSWIDANDAIFNKLRIWQKTDSSERLIALGEVGIGAIFLGSANTEFAVLNEDANEKARIKKSGFFLYENGKSGVIAQVDMAKMQHFKEPEKLSLYGLNFAIEKMSNLKNEAAKDVLQMIKLRLSLLSTELFMAKTKEQQDAINAKIKELLGQTKV